jgi:phospholipid/cholesterol/gamma-HCH transport system substrate-binding protein
MVKRTVEVSVGFLMLLAILALMFLALKVSGLSTTNLFGNHTYNVSANFTDIGNLKVRAPIRMAGVQIGSVSAITLNPENFQANVVLSIDNNISDVPSNSSASIVSSGLLGDNYVTLTPGYAQASLKNGSRIVTTYSATSIQSLMFFSVCSV